MKIGTMSHGAALAATVESLGSEITRLFAAMADGMRAAHEYERLSNTTDAALAREGLTRDRVANAVFERHFR